MGARQIGDVDVVAHAGPIGRFVVCAEEGQGLALARGDLQEQRDQVGLLPVALAVAGGGARRVEVAQAAVAQPVRGPVPAQRALEGQLGLAVGRLDPHRQRILSGLREVEVKHREVVRLGEVRRVGPAQRSALPRRPPDASCSIAAVSLIVSFLAKTVAADAPYPDRNAAPCLKRFASAKHCPKIDKANGHDVSG